MMRVIFNKKENILYTQAELDAAIAAARKDTLPVTANELAEGLRRYIDLFPGTPRLSKNQLKAILALVPARVRKDLAA